MYISIQIYLGNFSIRRKNPMDSANRVTKSILERTVWRLLKKLEGELPYGPGIPPGEHMIQRDACTPVLAAALLTIARTWEEPRCPRRGADKEDAVHAYNGTKKEATPFAASWTDLEIVILSKASRTERRDIVWHPLSVDPKQK